MNGMNDQRFHDLAMKTIAGHVTDAERAELDSLLAASPELKLEFERLRADVRIAVELLPMADAVEAPAREFPAYARERLQTKVRQTLGANPESAKEAESARGWVWRLWLGLATVTVVIVTLLIPSLVGPSTPVVQVPSVLVTWPFASSSAVFSPKYQTLPRESWLYQSVVRSPRRPRR